MKTPLHPTRREALKTLAGGAAALAVPSLGLAQPDGGVISIRRGADRGRANRSWLDAYHSFSFGNYHDPAHMGFRALRVINEDWIAPAAGFPMHPHRDMEIVTYLLAGALEHKDSIGNGGVIRPGEIQRMSAGTGIRHSEFNPSDQEVVHLLQIWILPDRNGHTPSYEQIPTPPESLADGFRTIAGPGRTEGAVTIHTDARISAARLAPGRATAIEASNGRYGWVHVARGAAKLGDHRLIEGDALALKGPTKLEIRAESDAEILWFDLA